jgi:hypothetical protein
MRQDAAGRQIALGHRQHYPRRVPRKPRTIQLPTVIRDELEEVARRARRSVGSLVRRALSAARTLPPATPPAGAPAPLALAVDDEDPADLPARIEALAGGRPLGDAVASAWAATREQFLAWVAREEEAAQLERADDLDQALADAASRSTAAERLSALADSEYPRVRALVAANPTTPPIVRARLAADRERTVRAAAGAAS